jgi:hypothetical protein
VHLVGFYYKNISRRCTVTCHDAAWSSECQIEMSVFQCIVLSRMYIGDTEADHEKLMLTPIPPLKFLAIQEGKRTKQKRCGHKIG